MKSAIDFSRLRWLVAIVIVCLVPACRLRYALMDTRSEEPEPAPIWRPLAAIEAEFGPISLPERDPAGALARAQDSLVALGIDSLITLRTERGPFWKNHRILERKGGKNHVSAKVLVSEAQPAYLFWAHDGHFFLQRFDRFDRYEAVERSFMDHYPLYDFGRVAKDSLDLQTTYQPRKEPDILTLWDLADSLDTGSDIGGSDITIKIGASNFHFVHHHALFQPQPLPMPSAQALDIGNNIRNYTHNAAMAQWIWQRLLMAEIGEVEALHLFRVVGE